MTQKQTKTVSKSLAYFCSHCGNVSYIDNAKMKLAASSDLSTLKISHNADCWMDQIFELRCPSCFAHMFSVDGAIAHTLAKFNMHGFPTIYSCSGHYNVRAYEPVEITSLHAYILFGYQPYDLILKTDKRDEAIKAITEHVAMMKKSIKEALAYSQSTTKDLKYMDYIIVTDSDSVNDDPRFSLEIDVKRAEDEKLNTFKQSEVIDAFRKVAKQIADTVNITEFDITKYLATLNTEPGVSWITEHRQLSSFD